MQTEIANPAIGIANVATPLEEVPTEIAETCIEIAGVLTASAVTQTLVQNNVESLGLRALPPAPPPSRLSP